MIKTLNTPLTTEEIAQAVKQNSDSMNEFLSTRKLFVQAGDNSLVDTGTFEERMPFGGRDKLDTTTIFPYRHHSSGETS